MSIKKSTILFSVFFILSSHSILAGFAEGTLVNTPHGYKAIETLIAGNDIYSANKNGELFIDQVKFTSNHIQPISMEVLIDNETITISPEQRFYLVSKKQWCQAKNLQPGDLVLVSNNKQLLVQSIFYTKKERQFFDITIENIHAFCITNKNIVVHNMKTRSRESSRLDERSSSNNSSGSNERSSSNSSSSSKTFSVKESRFASSSRSDEKASSKTHHVKESRSIAAIEKDTVRTVREKRESQRKEEWSSSSSFARVSADKDEYEEKSKNLRDQREQEEQAQIDDEEQVQRDEEERTRRVVQGIEDNRFRITKEELESQRKAALLSSHTSPDILVDENEARRKKQEKQNKLLGQIRPKQCISEEVIDPEFEIINQMPTLKIRNPFLEDVLIDFDNSADQSRAYSLPDNDEIQVFIPTKEFYERNKETFADVKTIKGCPVFIPESLEFGNDSLFRSGNDSFNGGSDGSFHPSSYGNGRLPPFDPKDPQKNKFHIQAYITAIAELAGTARYVAMAGGIGTAAIVSGPIIPIVVGTVIVGYIATISISGLKDPVTIKIEPNTKEMTKEQYEKYINAKKKYDDLEELQNMIQASKYANEIALKNGTYIECPHEPKIDVPAVDPKLIYMHSPMQRLLDISSPVQGSSDRFAMADGKVIKFTKCAQQDPYTVSVTYKASIVEDFGTLSKKDSESLRDYWNFNAKQRLKQKEKKSKQNDTHKNNYPSPGQDPDDKDTKKNHGPHGIYEENPKHHRNSRENVGKSPRDGKKMLDSSKSVPGEKYRINIENDKFVMLREHSPGRWHGYIVETFEELPEGAKKALIRLGLVRSYKSGKIIK